MIAVSRLFWVSVLVAAISCTDAREAEPELVPVDQELPSSLSDPARLQIVESRRAVEAAEANGDSQESLANAYGHLGSIFLAWSLPEYASAPLGNAAVLRPHRARWHYLLGHSLRQSGDFAEAGRSFERAMELEPVDVPTRVWLARVLLEQNRTDEAKPLLEAVLEGEPGNATAAFLLGQIEAQLGDHQRAVEWFEQAIAQQPSATRVHYPLSQSYRALGDMESAEKHLTLRGEEQVALADPVLSEVSAMARSSVGMVREGVALLQAGNAAAAAKRLQEAVELDASNLNALLNLGAALGSLGQLDEALSAFEQVLRVDPKNATALFNAGSIAQQQGDLGRAISLLTQAVESNPGYRNAHWSLGHLLEQDGRCAEALSSYDAVLSIDPSLSDVRLAKANCYGQLQRFGEMRSWLDQAHRIHPADLRIVDALVRLLAAGPEVVRDGAAAVNIATSLKHEPIRLRHLETLALADAASGDFAAAIAWQSRALREAREQGLHDFAARLIEQLERYEAGSGPEFQP